MKICKVVTLIVLALVVCLTMVACNIFNTHTTPEQTTPEQTTPQPDKLSPATLHYAAGAEVDEAAVKADLVSLWNLPEGTELTVSGTFDIATSGKYEITCTLDGEEQAVSIWVYANSATFYLNGQPLVDGNTTMKFLDARASENFTKGVTAVDSLGNELKIELDSRNMKFDNKIGSYLMYYHATDAAGQTFTVRVIYEIVFDYNMVATDTNAYYNEDSVSISVDFDGATGVWLEDSNGNRIDQKYYQVSLASIVLSKDYYKNYTCWCR